MPLFTITCPLLLIAIKELGFDPGIFTTLNTTCEDAKAENASVSAARTATLFDFFTALHPPLRMLISKSLGNRRTYHSCKVQAPCHFEALVSIQELTLIAGLIVGYDGQLLGCSRLKFFCATDCGPFMGTELPTPKVTVTVRMNGRIVNARSSYARTEN